MHYFIFLFFRHLEFSAGNVFETYHFRELSTEYRFIKSKCIFSITVEVNPGIYSRHMLMISNQSNMIKRSFLAPPVGFEPTTLILTGSRSTAELQGNIFKLPLIITLLQLQFYSFYGA